MDQLLEQCLRHVPNLHSNMFSNLSVLAMSNCVAMRVFNALSLSNYKVKSLNDEEGQAWVLVLPPWGRIYHWKSPIPQNIIPWSRFFDVDSLRAHAPVIEMEDWRKGRPL